MVYIKFRYLSLAIFIVAALSICICVTDCFDESEAASDNSETCGDISYVFDPSSGVLTIYGEGDMAGIDDNSDTNLTYENYFYPWRSFSDKITTVVIENGVKSIGHYAFYSCVNLSNVYMADSVTFIGHYSFAGCTSLTKFTFSTDLSKVSKMVFDYPMYEGDSEVENIKQIIGQTFQLISEKMVKVHTVTFVSEGLTLSQTWVPYGSEIVLPENPAKDSTDQFDYAFLGWEGYLDESVVTGNMEFNAIFQEKIRTYTVTLVVNHVIANRLSYQYGAVLDSLPEPQLNSDPGFKYVFSHWEEFTENTVVTDNCSYSAVFNKVAIVPEAVGDIISVRDAEGESVAFDEGGMSVLIQSARDNLNVLLRVSVSDAVISFDNAALRSFGTDAAELTLSQLEGPQVDQSLVELVGENAKLIDISFGSNKNFGEGKVTVSLPYVLAPGDDVNDLKIQYISEGQIQEELPCTYENGFVTFQTNHFSLYAIVCEGSDYFLNNSLIISDTTSLIVLVLVSMIILVVVMFFSYKHKKNHSLH